MTVPAGRLKLWIGTTVNAIRELVACLSTCRPASCRSRSNSRDGEDVRSLSRVVQSEAYRSFCISASESDLPLRRLRFGFIEVLSTVRCDVPHQNFLVRRLHVRRIDAVDQLLVPEIGHVLADGAPVVAVNDDLQALAGASLRIAFNRDKN